METTERQSKFFKYSLKGQFNQILLLATLLFFVSGSSFAVKTLEHVCINLTAHKKYNDLHIEFKQNVDSVKYKFVKRTGTTTSTYKGKLINRGGSKKFNIKFVKEVASNDSVFIKAFSKSATKIKEYYWTLDGEPASSKISVIYKKFRVKRDFSGSITVPKSIELIKVFVAKGKAKVVVKPGKRNGRSIITLSGKKKDNPKGLQIVVDPPEEFTDYVFEFKSGISATLFYILAGAVLLAILFMRIFKKK